ncbi:MAG: enoyl-[acyl-carrier-protein] reductase FabL [Chloroflexi bacterium]|nr:enoyl-[acyl-carrier-protein] reductase FabL [Chloroflexota bacterium]
MDLKGKVALVTGGSRGIGRAIALKLASQGADIVINFLRKKSAAEATAQEIQHLGVQTHLVKANVGEEEDIKRLFQEIKEVFEHLDIFVSNAASGVAKPITELGAREWEWTLGINARGFFLGAKEAAKLMEGRPGRIIALTSLGSQRVLPEYSMVGVSKAAVEALTRYLAVELAPQGILVNAVSPGVVDTDALNFFPSKDSLISLSKKYTPTGRMVTPEDVANVVAFLCSEEASMICGQVIVIDGGISLLFFKE